VLSDETSRNWEVCLTFPDGTVGLALEMDRFAKSTLKGGFAVKKLALKRPWLGRESRVKVFGRKRLCQRLFMSWWMIDFL
jgi:hypothetical protein